MNAKKRSLAHDPRLIEVNVGIFFFLLFTGSTDEESSSSASKFQVRTPPCFVLDISWLSNITISK